MEGLLGQSLRFLMGGGANTLATYGLYWLLLVIVAPQIAYAISFAIGVALSYVLNLRFVFRKRHSIKKMALFPLIYMIVYLVGAGALHIAIRYLEVHAGFAPLLSIASTLPISFLLTRWLLTDRSSTAAD